MTMVYASPPPRRAHNRDSQAEVETRIFVRRSPHAWRNVFLEPWKASDPPLPWAIPSATMTAVTLTAPIPLPVARAKPRPRSIMPWVVFLAAFGIAFGIANDRALRAELASELRVATARTIAVLETSATRLGRQAAEPR